MSDDVTKFFGGEGFAIGGSIAGPVLAMLAFVFGPQRGEKEFEVVGHPNLQAHIKDKFEFYADFVWMGLFGVACIYQQLPIQEWWYPFSSFTKGAAIICAMTTVWSTDKRYSKNDNRVLASYLVSNLLAKLTFALLGEAEAKDLNLNSLRIELGASVVAFFWICYVKCTLKDKRKLTVQHEQSTQQVSPILICFYILLASASAVFLSKKMVYNDAANISNTNASDIYASDINTEYMCSLFGGGLSVMISSLFVPALIIMNTMKLGPKLSSVVKTNSRSSIGLCLSGEIMAAMATSIVDGNNSKPKQNGYLIIALGMQGTSLRVIMLLLRQYASPHIASWLYFCYLKTSGFCCQTSCRQGIKESSKPLLLCSDENASSAPHWAIDIDNKQQPTIQRDQPHLVKVWLSVSKDPVRVELSIFNSQSGGDSNNSSGQKHNYSLQPLIAKPFKTELPLVNVYLSLYKNSVKVALDLNSCSDVCSNAPGKLPQVYERKYLLQPLIAGPPIGATSNGLANPDQFEQCSLPSGFSH